MWLAAADARGHLARAHLARGLLARRGVAADIVTTSEEGRRFLAALGTPSEVLSPHYGVAFDAWQNMDRRRTEACVLRYFLQPSRGLADLRRLAEIAEGASYVVNDFHPLPLLAGERAGRVVHVYGASLYRAIARHFEGRGPGALDRRFAGLVSALAARAHARVEHGLAAPPGGSFRVTDRTFVLPPLVALPRRSRREVRDALGVPEGGKLAAVYLNPHFRDPRLAAALRGALEGRGYILYGVGEGLADHLGFRPHDGSFADVAAASDVLVSAPGMASCAQARAFGLPFVALATDQPEQRSNLRALSSYPLVAPVDLLAPEVRADVSAALGAALDRAERARALVATGERAWQSTAPFAAEEARAWPSGGPLAAARTAHERWADVLVGLLPPTARIQSGEGLSDLPGRRRPRPARETRRAPSLSVHFHSQRDIPSEVPS